MRRFWRRWWRKTPQEKRYIRVLESALHELLGQFKDHIVCIYPVGSFVVRELRGDSDINLVIVVKHDMDLSVLADLRHYYHSRTSDVPLDIQFYGLDEFATGSYRLSQSFDRNVSPRLCYSLLSTVTPLYGKHVTGLPTLDRQIILRELWHDAYSLIGEHWADRDRLRLFSLVKKTMFFMFYLDGQSLPYSRKKLLDMHRKEGHHFSQDLERALLNPMDGEDEIRLYLDSVRNQVFG